MRGPHGGHHVGALSDLEGDHTLVNIFAYLAKKDPTRKGCDVRLPHTIVYQHGSLRAWYHYDAENQEIVRKERKHCAKEEIWKEFVSDAPPTQPCVATFLYRKCEFMEEVTEHEATSVEFLSRDGLMTFLNKRERRPDGILQKFIIPKSYTNGVTQVVWTPYLTLLNSRKNIHNLFDKRFSLYDRCVTHEGKSHLSTEVYSSPKLAQRFNVICKAIAAHMVLHERRLLTRAVLYFKVDQAGDLFLLWPASLVLVHLGSANVVQNLHEKITNVSSKQDDTMRSCTSSASATTITATTGHNAAAVVLSAHLHTAAMANANAVTHSNHHQTANSNNANTTTFLMGTPAADSSLSAPDDMASLLATPERRTHLLGSGSHHTLGTTTSSTNQLQVPTQPIGVQRRLLLNLSPAFTSPVNVLRMQKQLGLQLTDEYCVVPEDPPDLLNRKRGVRYSSHDEIAAGAAIAIKASADIPPNDMQHNHERWRRIERQTKRSALSPVRMAKGPPEEGGAAFTPLNPSSPTTPQANKDAAEGIKKGEGNDDTQQATQIASPQSKQSRPWSALSTTTPNSPLTGSKGMALPMFRPRSAMGAPLRSRLYKAMRASSAPRARGGTQNGRQMKRLTTAKAIDGSSFHFVFDPRLRSCWGGGGGMYMAPDSAAIALRMAQMAGEDESTEEGRDGEGSELSFQFSTEDEASQASASSDTGSPTRRRLSALPESEGESPTHARGIPVAITDEGLLTDGSMVGPLRSALKGVDEKDNPSNSQSHSTPSMGVTFSLPQLMEDPSVTNAHGTPAATHWARNVREGGISIDIPQGGEAGLMSTTSALGGMFSRTDGSLQIRPKKSKHNTSTKTSLSLSLKALKEELAEGHGVWEYLGHAELEHRYTNAREKHKRSQEWLEDFMYGLYSTTVGTIGGLASGVAYIADMPAVVHRWIGVGVDKIFEATNVQCLGIVDDSTEARQYEVTDDAEVKDVRKYLQHYRALLARSFLERERELFLRIKEDAQALVDDRGAHTQIISVAALERRALVLQQQHLEHKNKSIRIPAMGAVRAMNAFSSVLAGVGGFNPQPALPAHLLGGSPLRESPSHNNHYSNHIATQLWMRVMRKVAALCELEVQRVEGEIEAAQAVVPVLLRRMELPALRHAVAELVPDLPPAPGPLQLG